jgi:hypothetical protein
MSTQSTLAPKSATIQCDPTDPEKVAPDPNPKTLTGKDARDQCNIVSSQADNLIAGWGGLAKVAANLLSFGLADIFGTETQARTNIRNLLNIDLSTCEIAQLQQACSSEAIGSQVNTLIFDTCDYCNRRGCTAENISQTNTSVVTQSCVMQSLLDILSRKKATQDVTVAMEVVQKALGGASATSNTDICNNFKVDQTSDTYVHTQQECIQKAYGDQTNLFRGCGNARNIAQSNLRTTTQACMAGVDIDIENDTESGQSGDTSFKLDLSSTGVIAAASGGSCCIIIIIFFIWQMFFSG